MTENLVKRIQAILDYSSKAVFEYGNGDNGEFVWAVEHKEVADVFCGLVEVIKEPCLNCPFDKTPTFCASLCEYKVNPKYVLSLLGAKKDEI